ncbi:AMP-binding protein [Neolewinella litorea]|uniref:AMP-dependent synthetase n=1 Tax=Neolewinella litorea TaxID=2562452 RepID=A0A4S4N8W7_9BACT|nr:AMP-binding protein [Neolewinella litorea]THH35589.1 AMP-dependent synthetase [Neolewinella litorea]
MLKEDQTQAAPRDETAGEVQRLLQMYQGSEIRVAHLLCDRHADAANGLALIYEDASGGGTSCTYAEIRDLSVKFAAVLRQLGVTRGSRVATLLPPIPELLITTLAIWRLGAIHVPLSANLDAEGVQQRLEHSGAGVVVTDADRRSRLRTRAEAQGSDNSPGVVTITGRRQADEALADESDTPFWPSLHSAKEDVNSATLSGDDPFVLLYPPGRVEAFNGVEVPVRKLASIEAYMRFGLGLEEADRFWNIADPGGAYGLFYALIGPLLLDQTTLFYNAPFNVQSSYRILMKHGITNLVAYPSVYRRMRAEGLPEGFRKQIHLRAASSVGDALSSEVIEWAQDHLGVRIHEHYGWPEVGMILANHQFPALQRPSRAGSIGHAAPGFRITILDDDGREAPPGQTGRLAVDTGSPFFFLREHHLGDDPADRRFTQDGHYYLTGDTASQDADGYFFLSEGSGDTTSRAHGHAQSVH